MGRTRTSLLTASLLPLAMYAPAALAGEVVLDFESASSTTNYTAINSGYGGLTWGSDVYVIHRNAILGTGYEYGTLDTYSIFSWFSRNIEIDFPSNIDLDGAYITNAWTTSSSVTVNGYSSGVLLYSTTVNPSTTAPTWYTFNFDGIDELVMTPSDYYGQGHFVVDELTYWTDADGDGFGRTDCDDTDSSIYPGATEYCDGVDNNCDGTIDESTAVGASTWYRDSDNDNYGDPQSRRTPATSRLATSPTTPTATTASTRSTPAQMSTATASTTTVTVPSTRTRRSTS